MSNFLLFFKSLIHRPRSFLRLGSGLVVGLSVGVMVLAFNNPTGNPPTGTGAIIGVGSGAPANSIYVNSSGNVGIGMTNPGAKLEVAGQIKITGGAPGANKVLTSDAVGLASWQAPASSGITLPPGAVFFMITGSCPAGTTDVSATYANKFLRANAVAGSTGGSDTVSLTTANLPSHTHGVGTLTAGNESAHTHTIKFPGPSGSGVYDGMLWSGTTGRPLGGTMTSDAGSAHTHSLSGDTASVGSGAAVTVTNPYVTAKMCQVN